MRALVELPDPVLRKLVVLAEQERTTTAELIQRIVEDHLATRQPNGEHGFTVSLPLIPASESGPIQQIFGKDLDDLLARDDFPA